MHLPCIAFHLDNCFHYYHQASLTMSMVALVHHHQTAMAVALVSNDDRALRAVRLPRQFSKRPDLDKSFAVDLNVDEILHAFALIQ